MSPETYLSELVAALQQRGADSERTSRAVAEIERQLKETGADLVETFGSPSDLAEQLLQKDEQAVETEWVWRTFRATAFDEMKVLEDAGRQGWELMDVGAYALHCRRQRETDATTQWEYSRRVSLDRRGMIETMTELGWAPCGTWMPFQYFKRQVAKPAVIPD